MIAITVESNRIIIAEVHQKLMHLLMGKNVVMLFPSRGASTNFGQDLVDLSFSTSQRL